jgi:PAS domain S-box-containing protein
MKLRLKINQSTDPDDARRRRLLNIVLAGTTLIVVLGIVAVGGLIVTGVLSAVDFGQAFVALVLGLLGNTVIFIINRYWSGTLASALMLIFVTILFSFSDTPQEVSHGRSLFYFAIPIIMASVLLRSYASFFMAALTSLVIIRISLNINLTPDPTPVIGFFGVALISWLSSRSLEEALVEVRTTNANLDKLVAERTQELANALARELGLAGRNQAILESIADGVIVFDVDGSAIQANPALADLLDLPIKTITSAKITDLSESKDLDDKNRELLAELLTHPGKSEASPRIVWSKKTLSVSSAPVQSSEGTTIGTVAVFRDFTHEAELERLKSRFVAMISHELRTPLNAIMGYSEMIKESVYGPVNEKQAKASERIISNSQHLLGMVGELLDQAHMEAGKLKIQEEAFKPADLLDNLHSVMEHVAGRKELALTSELDPTLPKTLIGDAGRLHQILVNLVNNAIKFTERGGIHVKLYKGERGHWGIQVQDTGRGIPEEELPHIFDPFHQVDSTTTREYGGFGLGLSIVKQLINLMNGEIKVESKIGSGSTFTISLPAKQGTGDLAMSKLGLIIEDDEDLTNIFAEALITAGYETEIIRDGSVAQQKLEEIVPDLVVLDMHLPHVDGVSLLNQIRTDKRLAGTLVIIATADAVLGDMYRDTADFVLIKPISFSQLRDLSVRLRNSVTGSPSSQKS